MLLFGLHYNSSQYYASAYATLRHRHFFSPKQC